MLRRFSVNFAVLSLFLDWALLVLAFLIAVAARRPLNILPFVEPITSPVIIPITIIILFPLLWVGILLLFSVYDGRKNLKATHEVVSLTFGSILAAISMAGVLYLSFREISRFLFLTFIGMGYGFVLGWRVIYRIVYKRNIFGMVKKRRVIIVGSSESGVLIAEKIREDEQFNLELVGWIGSPECPGQGDQILGPLEAAHEIIGSYKVDDVILALPRMDETQLVQVVSELHDLPVRVWVIPDYYSLALHKASIEEFAGLPLLDLRAPALSDYQRFIKRVFDLLVSFVSLPIIIPFCGVIGLLIKLDSWGPVFYSSSRVGENGRVFKMLKFRSMVADAEKHLVVSHISGEVDKVNHKKRDDPRITRIGKFLRRTSIDEIPQIWNVLRGEMSLVGPRPELPELVEKYDTWQRKRFAVPQGMTGWWQINGRSDKPMHLHTEEDLYYVQHYSIWLDLQIIIKTIWVVISGQGAF